jgi:hypothetical protein
MEPLQGVFERHGGLDHAIRENFARPSWFIRLSFETAQYRVVARRHANSLDQTLSWTPAHAMAEKINDFGGSLGAARSRRRDLGQLRGERLTRAGFVSTLPALEAKLHSYRRPLRRQIL